MGGEYTKVLKWLKSALIWKANFSRIWSSVVVVGARIDNGPYKKYIQMGYLHG